MRTCVEGGLRKFLPVPPAGRIEPDVSEGGRSDQPTVTNSANQWWQAIHEAEAAIGFRCDHLSVRELFDVAATVNRDRWRHTATIAAMVINAQKRFVRKPITAESLLSKPDDDQPEVADGKWMQQAFGVNRS